MPFQTANHAAGILKEAILAAYDMIKKDKDTPKAQWALGLREKTRKTSKPAYGATRLLEDLVAVLGTLPKEFAYEDANEITKHVNIQQLVKAVNEDEGHKQKFISNWNKAKSKKKPADSAQKSLTTNKEATEKSTDGLVALASNKVSAEDLCLEALLNSNLEPEDKMDLQLALDTLNRGKENMKHQEQVLADLSKRLIKYMKSMADTEKKVDSDREVLVAKLTALDIFTAGLWGGSNESDNHDKEKGEDSDGFETADEDFAPKPKRKRFA